MPHLELSHVAKHYDSTTVLPDLSLEVEAGELMCLLGPSGCGKTTTLRVVAGFEAPDSGKIRLANEDVTALPSQKRDIGIVFQSYALFPHLTVNENVGFGLKMRRRSRAETAQAVNEALKLVQLENVGHRLPRQLSGGQQQRVALARAIAIRPRLLLLDEPLSNLDAKLRDEMRTEIRRVQRTTGITTLFVTHDQIEALALADRMAIMDQGRIVQVDTPVNIYERPAHPFVASFIGQANLIRGTVSAVQGSLLRVVSPSLEIVGQGNGFLVGAAVIAIIKSERFRLASEKPLDGSHCIPVTIESRTYLGATMQYICATAAEKLTIAEPNGADNQKFEIGDAVFAAYRPSDCLILASEDKT
ncbi:MAG TPA: ABC transporter ATP-binding protein [Candidatus Acidoferrales bacterium]|jgi:ABC-type Fe3+/spermidine/putrescine transport system ATPase subunit|nr:ABC transporter ATP-binding protein [Candidatus Acidoferrales bacterium]